MATIEEKAKAMGHVPKEEWKGDPDKWRPAEEFVERGENIIPILKKRLDETNKKLDDMGSDLKTTIKANAREVEAAKKDAFDRATKDYEDKLKALDKKEIEAFEDGDAEKFTKIKKERDSLEKPVEPKKIEEKKGKVAPEFDDWSKKETWYQKDNPQDELTIEADVQAIALAKKHPDKTLKEIFEMTATNVKKLHPDKFKNSRRDDAGAVEDDEGSRTDGNKTFASLPKSAKDAYARLKSQFKAKGREYKKEDYARDYYE